MSNVPLNIQLPDNIKCKILFITYHRSHSPSFCCRYVYEGYLYSSSIDYLDPAPSATSYTWTLLGVGWVLPNLALASSHTLIICLYKWVNTANAGTPISNPQLGFPIFVRQKPNI